MKKSLQDRITAHGENLKTLFGLPGDLDPVKLCKQLRRIETALNHAFTLYCNQPNFDPEPTEHGSRARLIKIIGPSNATRIFFNRDPRGYALKINLEPGEALHCDFGGYGIVAPDLSED